MSRGLLVLIAAVPLSAQTNIYLRASAPAPQVIVGASNSTPIVVQTYGPHGFSASCNLTTNPCYCGGSDIATGTGLSPANRPMVCTVADSTHLNLYDISGNPIAGNGAWFNGNNTIYLNGVKTGQYIGLLTKFTIPASAGPLGFLDGTNGDLMRRVKGDAYNGTSGLSLTGCPSACVITWTASYSFASSTFPMAAGNHFSISGTGTALDTCGDGTVASGENSPYTAASVIGGIVTSNPFACSISNGDYLSINPHCGPAATPNDSIGGSLYCTTVSQLAYVGNPAWDWMKTKMINDHLDCTPAPSCRSSYTNYKTTFDGGVVGPEAKLHANYAMAAIRFLVDPSQPLWLNISIYSLNHDYRQGGVGYTYNTLANAGQSDGAYNYTADENGLALEYAIVSPYWTTSEKASYLARTYADLDDPLTGQCTTSNQDAANPSMHNWVMSSGNVAAGANDATHIQLPVTDPHYSTANYYNGLVIETHNGGDNTYTGYNYRRITAQSNTGLLTTTSGPTTNLDNILDATYVSAGSTLSCSGTAGMTAGVTIGSGGAIGTITLSGTNTISNGTPIYIAIPGSGYASAPTTGGSDPDFGTASCSGALNLTSHIGTAYVIYDTFTLTTTAPGATAVATFTKTTNLNVGTTPPVSVGDGIMGFNGWGQNFRVDQFTSIVTAVGTNTLTVINGDQVSGSTSTPMMAWRLPKYNAGDCGRLVATKAQGTNAYGVNAALYGSGPVHGVGALQGPGLMSDTALNGGGSDPNAWMAMDLVAAPDSPSAVRDLIRQQFLIDWGVRPAMDFWTGRCRDAAGYCIDEDVPAATLILWELTQSVPSYPKLDVASGPWGTSTSGWWTMFSGLPDLASGNVYAAGWAGAGYQLYEYAPQGTTSSGLGLNPVFTFVPNSSQASYLKYWQQHVRPNGTFFAMNQDIYQALTFLALDPRIGSTSYNGIPHQYAFTKSSSAAMTSSLGWSALYRGDAIISRSGWTSTNDTLSLFDCATFTAGVYDSPRSCQFSLWSTGALIGADSNPANGLWAADPSVVSDSVSFNSFGMGQFKSGSYPNIGITPVTLWAQDTAGSFGSEFGDNSSNYIAACGNELPNYNQTNLGLSLSEVQRCVAELKVSGHDHYFFTFDEVALGSGSASMTWHLHYPQNGQSQGGGPTGSNPTGSTTCPGSGGCASVNGNGRIIESVQDGNGTSPVRTHGLLSYITSPSTIYVVDDCVGHGGGQCAPGDTYTGGNGWTHRFEIGGGASVGSKVSSMTSVVGHKLMSSLSDTTFTPTDLNPDGNWTGVKLAGANTTGVVLFGRNGTHSSMTGFTAASALPVDWMFVGVAPGMYAVTVGGTPVAGSPFTVTAGSNTIFFRTSSGGAVLLGPSVGAPTATSGRFSITGNIAVR